MKCVLDVRRVRRVSEELLAVGLVPSPQEFRGITGLVLAHVQVVHPERLVFAEHHVFPDLFHHGFLRVSLVLVAPPPRVAVPQRRQDVNPRASGPAVAHLDADEDITRVFIGVLDEHVPVLPLVENPRVFQLVLGVVEPPPSIFIEQFPVRVFALRVLVQAFHVRVGGRRIEVVIALLDVFSVVPFVVDEAEQSLLEDRILLVPETEREAQTTLSVAYPEYAVFSPAIRTRASLLVWKITPTGNRRMQNIKIES